MISDEKETYFTQHISHAPKWVQRLHRANIFIITAGYVVSCGLMLWSLFDLIQGVRAMFFSDNDLTQAIFQVALPYGIHSGLLLLGAGAVMWGVPMLCGIAMDTAFGHYFTEYKKLKSNDFRNWELQEAYKWGVRVRVKGLNVDQEIKDFEELHDKDDLEARKQFEDGLTGSINWRRYG